MGVEMTGWNFADVYEAVAAKAPHRPCQIQGDRVITWGQFDARAERPRRRHAGRRPHPPEQGGRLPLQRPRSTSRRTSRPSGGFAPVNTNYRYGHDEIVYLFDNADAEAVVFHATFLDLVEQVRQRTAEGEVVLRAGWQCRVPGWGARLRDGGRCAGGRPRAWPCGGVAATTCCCCTRAAPRACRRV